MRFHSERSESLAMHNQPKPTRKRWLVTLGFFALLVVVYAAVCFLVEHTTHRTPDLNHVAQLRPYMVVAGLIALAGSVAWLRFRVDGKIGEEGRELISAPPQFLTDSIVAFSLSNYCALLGLTLFFMGAPAQEFLFFAVGTLVVDFAFILPRGLKFWATYNKRGDLRSNGTN